MTDQQLTSRLESIVRDQTDACLAVYREDPSRIEQDANNELRISQGGYGQRQIHELLQNGIDAARTDNGSRLEVVLSDTALYVANDGAAFTEAGVRAVMASDLSRKEGDSIGRFGIGFKSVLAVSDSPKVYSRTISFGFDAHWAETSIRQAGFEAPRFPVMRLAAILDQHADRRTDPILDGLMDWASTVILLPLKSPSLALEAQLFAFPAEFMLFSRHMRSAAFRRVLPTGDIKSRVMRVEKLDDRRVTLTADGVTKEWAVLSGPHQPSAAALEDAGRIAARESVAVTWAIPRDSSARIGTFWAYVPTLARTTLSGLINAPWKLSDDRTDLLDGAFNRELLEEALPRLFTNNLDLWGQGEDTLTLLDLMPARGDESRSWADGVVNEPMYKALRSHACLADGTKTLRKPSELRIIPEGLPIDWVRLWAESSAAPLTNWIHPDSQSTPERRSKVRRLINGREGSTPGVSAWIESLTGPAEVAGSADAIRLAAVLVSQQSRANGIADFESQVRSARVLLLENGSLARPVRGRVFIRTEAGESGHLFVDPELVQEPGVERSLATLGVEVLDRRGRLRALLVQSPQTPAAWTQVWVASRELTVDDSAGLIREELGEHPELKALAMSAEGRLRPLSQMLLPGAIIPADAKRDRAILIDPRAHHADFELMRELGAVSEPVWRRRPAQELWTSAYKQAVTDGYLKKYAGLSPDRADLNVDGETPPWPLDPLQQLSLEGRVLYTERLLVQGIPRKWQVSHRTKKSDPTLTVESPLTWLIRRHGLLQTPFGPLRPERTVQSSEELEPHARVLPVVSLTSDVATALGVRADLEALTEDDWRALKAIADLWEDDDRRFEFYAWLPGRIAVDSLVVRVGRARQEVELHNIGVTSDRSIFNAMLDAAVPALRVEQQEDVNVGFIGEWGMQDGRLLLQEEIVFIPSGEVTYLLDEFKPLALLPAMQNDQDIRLQRCERIERLVATSRGQVTRPIAQMRDGDTVRVTAKADVQTLEQVSRALDLDLDRATIDNFLQQMSRGKAREARKRIREAASDELRLLEAVGVDALRRSLPANAIETIEHAGETLAPESIAALSIAVHGVSVLEVLRGELNSRGLEPPREWTGRKVSREFVADLGFPIEWAGFPAASRDAIEIVDGPRELPALHEYQVRVTGRIGRLLRGESFPRGMLSLPTGAGKTRVTVDAIISAIRNGEITSTVLWIAQSDELCEQAVETWRYVWRAAGTSGALSIGRLWASNEVTEDPSAIQLVVATDQKLQSIIHRTGDDYRWLQDPDVVVIDEAHTSISPMYTEIFEWLGGARSTVRSRPIIGLSATPYRGVSAEETKRLANRYGTHRLDEGVFEDDPYTELQRMGVLASIVSTTIDGVRVDLDDREADELGRLRRLPSAVEDRIGRDVERNRKIVDSIAALPDDWTVLLFGSSVENARTLAALLSHRGIKAFPISASTPTAARRHYIEQFRQGEVRVLTNFNVLTQGFDAPAVKAVYVARPVFSPNVYLQMVGRGLRGPANGGSEEVTIVNVEDNFNRFGELLAFREFDEAWKP